MKHIPRIYDDIEKLLRENRVTVLYGPRRVGKTTLINNFLKTTKLKYRLSTGDELDVREALTSESIEKIRQFTLGNDLIVIDEAQRIPNVGWGLKIMVDHIEKIKVLITGSASLNLSYKIGEPLLGRKFTYTLYPISQLELLQQMNKYDLSQNKGKYLIYGSYPEIISSEIANQKKSILMDIINSYLLKDILELETVKGAKVLMDLLRLIAFQIGKEVSLSELGNHLNLDVKTVARYLDLFEQAFIIYNVRGYSINIRKAVSKKSRYYFLDNGIRNAIIENFNDLDKRNDLGQLWENFIVAERLKKQEYAHIGSKYNNYFWRTWDQKEIDWVEMRDGKLFGYEIKWQDKSFKNKSAWLSSYQEAEFAIVNSENYLDFIT